MDPFAVLNYDVLNIILALLPPSDAGKLACTCRLAYYHAIPHLLSDVTLGLHFHRRPKSQLALFCNFVLSDVPNRVSLLRKLHLRRDAFPWVEVEMAGAVGNPRSGRAYMVDYSLAGRLAEVIQQADRLEEVLIASADPLLASEPRLVDALASRPRLCRLDLGKCGSTSLECVSRLSGSEVRSLTLSVDDQYVRQSSLYHNLSAFARVSKTLEVLDLDDAILLTGDLDPDFVLPSVRQLTLRGWADLSEILRVLPNLRVLHLHTCRFKAAPLSPSLVDFSHAQLDELITDAPVPLACAVRRVELRFNAFLQHHALAMLERMDPVVLSCHAGWSLPSRSVAQLLPSLRFLELHVKWRIADGVPDTPCEAWLVSCEPAVYILGTLIASPDQPRLRVQSTQTCWPVPPYRAWRIGGSCEQHRPGRARAGCRRRVQSCSTTSRPVVRRTDVREIIGGMVALCSKEHSGYSDAS
ncbi:uncharacterized protein B0H18DRAFT_664005 [Fomitopsis serialis]|uniref:uncharacterized protein n=1 Tax=Fomitopsis serialis TaxID=139415 RepID=UPI002008A81E|nr:uncharacterized protein B0H18DRAFT_664005 [Neoantrodia serialis]KAH9918684.1 hypothetical protein B0H18DRAFT_664005 [Neoantrodia serialis]